MEFPLCIRLGYICHTHSGSLDLEDKWRGWHDGRGMSFQQMEHLGHGVQEAPLSFFSRFSLPSPS